MAKNKINFLALASALLTLGLASCTSTQAANSEDVWWGYPFVGQPPHTSRTSLDWAGVYSGTVPTASGGGANIRITLNRDYTFEMQSEYLGRENGVFTQTGTFTWDVSGSIITLDSGTSFQVGEHFLRQLDMYNMTIQGEFAESYILHKEGS